MVCISEILFLVNADVGLILISSVSEVCMEMKVEVLTQLHIWSIEDQEKCFEWTILSNHSLTIKMVDWSYTFDLIKCKPERQLCVYAQLISAPIIPSFSSNIQYSSQNWNRQSSFSDPKCQERKVDQSEVNEESADSKTCPSRRAFIWLRMSKT